MYMGLSACGKAAWGQVPFFFPHPPSGFTVTQAVYNVTPPLALIYYSVHHFSISGPK